MRQLVQLRWLAVGGQLMAILVAHYGLGIALPLAPMLAIVAVLALANILFTLTLRRSWLIRGELLLALLLDMAALTAQLYLSGGSTNPFVALYLLQIVLGAILLPPSRAWLLVVVACSAAAFLAVRHEPLALPADLADRAEDVATAGAWIAFTMVAILLILFIARISHNLRARDAYVAELGQRAVEEDGIVRMGLFASGAAHELGTPLSTLDVLLADWRQEPAIAQDPRLSEDVEIAQAELRRCKQIVSNILHSAGQARGEAMSSVPVERLLGSIAAEWRAAHPGIPLTLDTGPDEGLRVAAEPALKQVIWSLVENAGEASPAGLSLGVTLDQDQAVIAVRDRGPGFAEAQLADVGRLYTSTKGPGRGLGLFLANNLARRLGGRFEVANRPEGGAEARLILPAISMDKGATP